MPARLLPLSLVLGTLLAAAGPAPAGDWAYWRGPEDVGVSRETGLISDWSLDGKNLLWTVDYGGRATPVIFGGRAFLNTRTEADVRDPAELIDAAQMTVCWDMASGKELWRDEFPVAQTDIASNRVGWASPVVDPESGNVYVHTVDGLLICYTPDGERVWAQNLYELVGHISGYGGRTTTPIVHEDQVIISFIAPADFALGPPPPKQTFYAFDTRTGDVHWTSVPGGPAEDTIYTNPVVTVIGGVKQLISGNADGGVYGIQARTGKPLWGFRMSKRGLNSSPVVANDLVYVCQGEDNIDTTEGGLGRVQCIDPTLGTGMLASGDLTENPEASVWRENGTKAGYASPTIADGVLYVVTDTGLLIAYDATSGKRLWDFTLGTVGKGSPVWADGKLYVMEVNGKVWILKPSREGCEELSEVVIPATTTSGPDEIYASPAISDGRILLVARDRTVCVGDPEAVKDGKIADPMGPEKAADGPVAQLNVIPKLAIVDPGDSVEFEVRAYNAAGRFLRTVGDAELKISKPLQGLSVDGLTATVKGGPKLPATGDVTVSMDDATATAQVRSYPPLPWKYDFNELTGKQLPDAWVNRIGKAVPIEKYGEKCLYIEGGEAARGKPSFDIWVGPDTMTDYVVKADFLVEGRRSLGSVGLTNERYSLIAKANRLGLEIQTWQAHLRLNSKTRFEMEPGEWYTMKLATEQVAPNNGDDDGSIVVLGKIWPRDEEEPSAWTIAVTDPHPNTQGAAGFYVYRLGLSNSYIDNFEVLPAE